SAVGPNGQRNVTILNADERRECHFFRGRTFHLHSSRSQAFKNSVDFFLKTLAYKLSGPAAKRRACTLYRSLRLWHTQVIQSFWLCQRLAAVGAEDSEVGIAGLIGRCFKNQFSGRFTSY